MSAVTDADYLRARLSGFSRKIDRAQSVISQAAKRGRIAVSFSGGKDSLVVLDLVRQVAPESLTVFFDSGAELAQTYETTQHYNATICYPEFSIIELLKYGGYWGYEHAEDVSAEFNFKRILIEEPSRRFARENNIAVQAIGLRRDESTGRWMNALKKGELYETADGWHLCPLAFWTVDDVWAYIASRGLFYNRAYDLMSDAGILRKNQRIGTLFGEASAGFGRFVNLKLIDLDLFNRLAAEFPGIAVYS